MKHFKQISPYSITDNVFQLIDKEWFLITAGNLHNFNTMTASWGALGIIWNKPVAFIFIRPTRHTFSFAEENQIFTLSFFSKDYKNILNFCGTKSGREVNKIDSTGLIPLEAENGAVYFEQARMVMNCKKIYFQDINPEHFLFPDIQKNYPLNDYHRMYIGEIQDCFIEQ